MRQELQRELEDHARLYLTPPISAETRIYYSILSRLFRATSGQIIQSIDKDYLKARLGSLFSDAKFDLSKYYIAKFGYEHGAAIESCPLFSDISYLISNGIYSDMIRILKGEKYANSNSFQDSSLNPSGLYHQAETLMKEASKLQPRIKGVPDIHLSDILMLGLQNAVRTDVFLSVVCYALGEKRANLNVPSSSYTLSLVDFRVLNMVNSLLGLDNNINMGKDSFSLINPDDENGIDEQIIRLVTSLDGKIVNSGGCPAGHGKADDQSSERGGIIIPLGKIVDGLLNEEVYPNIDKYYVKKGKKSVVKEYHLLSKYEKMIIDGEFIQK